MGDIYRAEQARMSFASEAAPGGYPEIIDTTDDAGDWTALLSSAHAAGSRSLTFDTSTGTIAVGNYILIGTAGNANAEVRRVISLGSYSGGTGTTGTIFIDYPLGFPHANNDPLDERDNTYPDGANYTAVSAGGHAQGTAGEGGINFATFLPGVYETITTPDLTPEFLPQYFLKDSADRNWSYMYRGKQSFNGALPNILLLNGYPLKYAFGQIASIGTDDGTGGSTLSAASLVGAREITLSSVTGYAAGEFIQVDVTTKAEVRQILAISSLTITLNYPLMVAHNSGVACNEVIAPYTHTIQESAKLPTMSWNVLMRDSGETAANDFIRRFVGGTVNRATLSADEGEMLRYSWDDVQFLDLVHNQTRNSAVTGDSSTADIMNNSSNMLLSPLGIGGDMPNASGAFGAPVYPTTEPYYYSQGCLTFFGVEFARIRNFSLEINNNIEPRYYMKDRGGKRIPSEIQESRREYRLTATIALPDTFAATATTRSLWKELLLEGNYAGLGNTAALTGFDMVLTFTRGTNDTITISSPSNATTSSPFGSSSTFDSQGCFFIRATHNIETDSPLQVDGEIIMRNMSIVVVDSIPVYP